MKGRALNRENTEIKIAIIKDNNIHMMEYSRTNLGYTDIKN